VERPEVIRTGEGLGENWRLERGPGTVTESWNEVNGAEGHWYRDGEKESNTHCGGYYGR